MTLFLWLKALHIIAVVAHMASLLLYPRYKIHQLKAAPGEPLHEEMKAAAHKLRNIIMTPSILAVWALGIAMLVDQPHYLSQGWFHVKFLLVLTLAGIHGFMVGIGKRIDSGTSRITPKRLKILNEIPFVLMFFVILLVVLKPF